LKFVSAADVEELLNELFLRRQERRRYWDYYDSGYESIDRDVGRLYGKVRIASEPYSNSIIVSTNSPENFDAIEAILKKLDRESEAGASTMRIQLKHAKAVTTANSLNILFAQRGAPPRRQTQQQRSQPAPRQAQPSNLPSTSFELEEEVEEETYFPWLGGGGGQDRSRYGIRTVERPVSDLVGKVRVVPDRRTNSLFLTSNIHFFPEVLKLIDQIDVPTAQVMIEARIVEVSVDDMDRLGVRWSPSGAQVFDSDDLDSSILAETNTSFSDVFAGTTLADATRTGILDVNVSLDFLIQFLRKNVDSRVRAEPRLNVADNERGKLFVGSRVPFIKASTFTTEGGRNDTFDYVDVGTTLELTPHINTDQEVALRILVEASQIRPGETLFGGAIIDTRNFRTDVTVKSGQTLVLGGIIRREQTEIVRKVPILGDIPLLGYLFSKTDSRVKDVELMVFLRPTVTRTPEEVQRLLEAERERAASITGWEEEIDDAK
jgi:general secretion pathway protein D